MTKKILLTALVGIFAHTAAEACTGLYVGKKVSVEGNPLIARTIDSADMYSTKSLHVFPRYENTPYGESSVVGYLAMSCTKAREAVKRFGELIAEKGHDGAEIYVFADAVVIAPGADDAFARLVREKAAARGIRVLGCKDLSEKNCLASKR